MMVRKDKIKWNQCYVPGVRTREGVEGEADGRLLIARPLGNAYAWSEGSKCPNWPSTKDCENEMKRTWTVSYTTKG